MFQEWVEWPPITVLSPALNYAHLTGQNWSPCSLCCSSEKSFSRQKSWEGSWLTSQDRTSSCSRAGCWSASWSFHWAGKEQRDWHRNCWNSEPGPLRWLSCDQGKGRFPCSWKTCTSKGRGWETSRRQSRPRKQAQS